MFKTNIHLFSPLHLCAFALNFQLTFGINRVASYPAGEADPANPVKFYDCGFLGFGGITLLGIASCSVAFPFTAGGAVICIAM
jgi:hypothetical protein